MSVNVSFADSISGSKEITYYPETKFKLVCNNAPAPGENMFLLRSEGEVMVIP
ncbi:MAG: hypothetical protein HQ557_06650 [Bacteroidetes bacterium]|nr:hypothetical protein [Bacteroidota bacterium]